MQFDTATGLLATVTNKHSGAYASVMQQMWQYKSGDKDGAYIFRPASKRTGVALHLFLVFHLFHMFHLFFQHRFQLGFGRF